MSDRCSYCTQEMPTGPDMPPCVQMQDADGVLFLFLHYECAVEVASGLANFLMVTRN